ncbi:MAG: hypothetical protein ABIF40_01510 [archaeon]
MVIEYKPLFSQDKDEEDRRIPLYLPLDEPRKYEEREEKGKDEKDKNRGVWIYDPEEDNDNVIQM